MKSILFINRVYPPVEGATGQLLAELAPELAQAGWKVTVLSADPEGMAPRLESSRGVESIRVAGLPFSRASHWRRALAYLSLYPSLLWRAWRLPRHDFVVTMTDPPLLVFLGTLLRWLKGSRSIHWAQDLYPELAEELRVLPRGGLLANLLRRVSTHSLKRCDAIIAVGRCMKELLQQRGIEASRIQVISNWGHGSWSGLPLDPELNPFRQRLQLAGRFVVMYSGNFGMAHPFEAVLDAAEQLVASQPNALFILIGQGPRLAWVQEQAAASKLTNIRFLPSQPKACLAETLAAADLHLATMENHLCGLVVPSKVAGVLSAGRPCLFLGPAESEAARLILEQDFGEVVSRPTGPMLAARLTFWMQRPNLQEWTKARAATVAPVVGLSAAVAAFSQVFSHLGAPLAAQISAPNLRGVSPADAASLSRAKVALPHH